VKTEQNKVEKASLGDLGVMADLRKKMSARSGTDLDSGEAEQFATEATKPE